MKISSIIYNKISFDEIISKTLRDIFMLANKFLKTLAEFKWLLILDLYVTISHARFTSSPKQTHKL